MICLLCCESNADFIALSSEQGKNSMIPSILFKYFRFMFENQPETGDICQKCWLRVEQFHQFYVKIQGIQSTLTKHPIAVENFECDLKLDDDLGGDLKDFDLSPEIEFSTATSWPDIADDSSDEHSNADAENVQNETKYSPPIVKDYLSDTVPTDDTQQNLEPDKEKYYTKVKCGPNKCMYVCDLCNESFTKVAPLKDHLKSNHSLNFQCKFCDKVLLNAKTLKTHIQSFHEPAKERKYTVKRKPTVKRASPKFKTIRCDICLEYFLTEKYMLKHQKLTHFALPFKCTHTQCKESFKTPELLEEHRKSAHIKVKCPKCPREVVEHLLDLHVQRAHNKTYQTVCEQCGKIFPDNFARKYHIKMDHGNPDRVQCDLCKGFFKNKYNLQKHIKVVHLEGPAVCSECGKITPNSKALQAHMLIHKQPNKECLVCGRRFKHSSKLREHSYIHSGITDAYECNFCGKKFRFGSSWSAHRMKAHPAEMAEAKQRLGKLKNIASQKMTDNGLRC